jgi:hypothetical protein
MLYYFRWTGTAAELKEYVGRINEICDQTDGVTFNGIFMPTSEWSSVILFEGTSYDKVLGVYKAFMIKYGSNSKIQVGKVEALHTFEELGMQM